jgi:hypothetical protein
MSELFRTKNGIAASRNTQRAGINLVMLCRLRYSVVNSGFR